MTGASTVETFSYQDGTGEREVALVRVTGVLDMAEALRLASFVEESPGSAELYVDLRRAREVHDAAVVAIAQKLRGRNGTLAGLSLHHQRLLGYVGEGAAASAS